MRNILEAEDLSGSFPGPRRSSPRLKAVKDVNLSIAEGECLGLVGESGSGKSTVARAIMQLVHLDSGRIVVNSNELTSLKGKDLRRARRDVQMVFQDPYSSLDPSMTVGHSVAEPLEIHNRISKGERDQRVAELLELVGMGAHHMDRYPHEFSGGQRQRIAIARALALNPSLVICDEAVSALDVSTQNQVISLLEELRERLGLAYLFISHDLAVVRHISDRVAVMYFGRIVEVGDVESLLHSPMHPYTQALLSSVPVPDPTVQKNRVKRLLVGEIPDIANPPRGCAFRSRCPQSTEICSQLQPELLEVAGTLVACHHVDLVRKNGENGMIVMSDGVPTEIQSTNNLPGVSNGNR